MEVWLLTIVGHNGIESSVYNNRMEAEEVLFNYVRDSWDEYLDGDEMPPGPMEAINYFFEAMEEVEWYELGSKEFPGAPPGENEVDLSEEEVGVALAALDYADYLDVAAETGVGPDRARQAMQGVRDKLRA